MNFSGFSVVNKELFPVKAQNFLKYGACAVFSFLPVITRQKGIPNEGVGLMWTFFPLINILSYLFLSQLADKFACHRMFFMSGLFVLFTGIAGVCFMPDINRSETNTNFFKNLKTNNLTLQCKDKGMEMWACNDYKSDSPIRDCSYNYTYENVNSSCEMNCSFDLSENLNEINAKNDKKRKTSKVIKVQLNSSSTCVTENCVTINLESEEYDLIDNLSCDKVYNPKCEIICSVPEKTKSKTSLTMSETISHYQFWMILFTMMIMYSGNSIATTMCDTATFEILGDNRHLYGFQRLWGSLAWGIMGILYGAIVDYFSSGLTDKDYTSAFIVALIVMVFAIISGAFIKFKIPKREETGSGSVRKVFKSSKVLLFMGCILVIGGSQGCLWTFLFMVMEDVAIAWKPDFQSRTLLQGLCLAIGCFLGEVPLMFLSGHIIKSLGNIRTFTLSLVAYSARFFLHSFVVNPWFFLPIEILHGISFGVFYPNMSAYASKIAPKGKKATMQGIVKATFGAGMSLGSLIGGALFKMYGGSQLFFYIGILDTAYTIFFVSCHILISTRNKTQSKDIETNEETTDPHMKLGESLLLNGHSKQIDNKELEEKKKLMNEIKA
ncbi:unnamed protein product [Meganyctiphanes norvegica]|uniref:Major facilitator superfamily (MFS) profile domain-containing protein n=1 Tax=Meganyctiphanes norvegica TaxID=48144 RepID=A0AAV2RIL4_MEGNR